MKEFTLHSGSKLNGHLCLLCGTPCATALNTPKRTWYPLFTNWAKAFCKLDPLLSVMKAATFSKRMYIGLRYRQTSKNSVEANLYKILRTTMSQLIHHNWQLHIQIDLKIPHTFSAAPALPLWRFILEKPWHGGPPQMRSTLPGCRRESSSVFAWQLVTCNSWINQPHSDSHKPSTSLPTMTHHHCILCTVGSSSERQQMPADQSQLPTWYPRDPSSPIHTKDHRSLSTDPAFWV